MLVEKYKLGNTIVEIYDDAYRDKTKEDIDEILKRIEDIGRKSLYRQVEAEEA